MSDTTVNSTQEAEALPPGQWAIGPDGRGMCLVDTNVGWSQRMWMSDNGRSYDALDNVTYPMTLADVDEDCPHSWGTQECGHCRHCGAVVEAPRDLDWNLINLSPKGAS